MSFYFLAYHCPKTYLEPLRYKDLLLTLLSKQQLPFDSNLHGLLPLQKGGVYRIFEKGSTWQNSLYVGATASLRNRVYTNHLMGDSVAGLKGKLIKEDRYNNENDIKEYLQSKCLVQYILIPDENLRMLFEHFAISILKPQYSD